MIHAKIQLCASIFGWRLARVYDAASDIDETTELAQVCNRLKGHDGECTDHTT